MQGEWKKGDCHGCKQRMYVNADTGLCVKCENAMLKSTVLELKGRIGLAEKEIAFYRTELAASKKELSKFMQEARAWQNQA